MRRDDIDVCDLLGFWTRPMREREEAFAFLRENDPISFFDEHPIQGLPQGPGIWAITRHADLIEVSKRPEDFCSGQGYTLTDLPLEFSEFYGSMLGLDDPRHARIRRLVSAAFTPRMLAKLERDVDDIAAEIVDGLAERDSFDFVTDLAARLPLRIICNMMSIPEDQHDVVLAQTNVILSSGDPEFMPDENQAIDAFLMAGATLAGLMDQAIERLGDTDDGSVLAALVRGEMDGDQLTREELQSFFVLLCTAGSETTRTAISWGLYYLTENPAERDKWWADFDGVANSAVEEIVRMSSPVTSFRRTVTRDGVQLGDHTFSAGDKVVLWYNSANRDATVFEEPDRFDVTRSPNHHVGYGGPGPHFCLGAHLARREITVMFREIHRTMPDIVSVGEPDQLRSSFINGVKHLLCDVNGYAPVS